MDWAVLVKGVPPVDQLRFDPERKTMIREGTDLGANPFDRRALQLALNLRKAPETVTVISMGPPTVEPVLREALALGADRTILVSDAALAGSDTLVTAQVLHRALERVGHEMTLLGRWSVDSETGQVGPEVAGFLGVPIISGLRELRRDPDGSFFATSTTRAGSRRTHWRPPVVLTVGEDAVRVRRPSPDELEAARGKTLQRWTAAHLGLEAQSLGLAGSPTIVVDLRKDEPTRNPVVYDAGSLQERVDLATHEIRSRLTLRRTSFPDEIPPLPRPLGDQQEAVVMVTGGKGQLEAGTLPFFGELRARLPRVWPSAVWVGPRPSAEEIRVLAASGAIRLYLMETRPSRVASSTTALAVQTVFDRRPRAVTGLLLADTFGREVAGQLAARMGLGLVGDAVGMRWEERSGILWEKPSFGGGIIASIRCRTTPSLATVREGSFPERILKEPTDPTLDVESIPCQPLEVGEEDLGEEPEVDPAWGDLDNAHVVLTVGTGVGGPEGMAELLPLAGRLGAAIGATRRVADAGWLPRQLQVGLTGRSVAPVLAVLVGVSGATNHLVGLRRARVLVALNSDPNAPVFRSVDVGLVGPWRETLPQLVEALKGFEPLVRP